MSKFQNDAIFWVDVDKIDPNPYQPRRDFNEEGLRDLAESIRQYGVLQPLTVTRNEETKEDGGLKVYYELIAGERRLRAAKMANLSQVPVTIRDEKEDAEVKLELAIIENLQREDLNPIERAEAFNQLSDEFDFTHKEIAEKIGKSREYVSNSMRLLKLPEKIKQAVIAGKITEGHARPIMMLRDKPEKQQQLFKEVVRKDLTVRETEERARRDAQDKVRKKKNKIDPETKALEEELSDTLGTRVTIEKDKEGGKLVIDFFSDEDLQGLIEMVKNNEGASMDDVMKEYAEALNDDDVEEKSEQEEQTDKLEGSETENSEEPDNQGEEVPAQTDASQTKAGSQGGQSMAETLGTMIQQARAEQEGGKSEEGDQQEKSDKTEVDELQEKPQDTQPTETASEPVTEDQSEPTQEPEPADQKLSGNQSRDSKPDKQEDQSTVATQSNVSPTQADTKQEQVDEPAGPQQDSATVSEESTDESVPEITDVLNQGTEPESSQEDGQASAGSIDEQADSQVSDETAQQSEQSKETQKQTGNKQLNDPGAAETKDTDQQKSQDNSPEENQAAESDQEPDNEQDQAEASDNEGEDGDMYSISNFSV